MSEEIISNLILNPRPATLVEVGWGLAYLDGTYWMTSMGGLGKLRAGVHLDFDLHSEHIIA